VESKWKTTTLQLFLDSLSPENMRDASSGVKLKIALFGDLSLEEAMDLSRDRQILELELREIGWGGMDWIDLGQDRDQWRTLVNTVMNLRVL
jgi:hypothetical protein